MVFQLFVRDLSGHSHCLQLDASSTTRREILHRLGYTSCSSELSLQTGTRLLSAESVITAGRDGFFPSCHVSCRLLGGKGGFGSLLRGAATRAGQKKTSNFDACRDMSGRRLRHVNAEKKLKEWRHEGGGRVHQEACQGEEEGGGCCSCRRGPQGEECGDNGPSGGGCEAGHEGVQAEGC